MLKRALTVFADVEKSPDGLAALMGEPGKKDTMNFAMGLTEAPGWARFREDELADWLNTFLARVWPFYNRSICNLVRSLVEPLLENHRPSMFRRINFEKLDLGDQPIQVPKVRWLGTRSDGMGASIGVGPRVVRTRQNSAQRDHLDVDDRHRRQGRGGVR